MREVRRSNHRERSLATFSLYFLLLVLVLILKISDEHFYYLTTLCDLFEPINNPKQSSSRI